MSDNFKKSKFRDLVLSNEGIKGGSELGFRNLVLNNTKDIASPINAKDSKEEFLLSETKNKY